MQPLTPPRQADLPSLSPASANRLSPHRVPVSPPQSTYSDGKEIVLVLKQDQPQLTSDYQPNTVDLPSDNWVQFSYSSNSSNISPATSASDNFAMHDPMKQNIPQFTVPSQTVPDGYTASTNNTNFAANPNQLLSNMIFPTMNQPEYTPGTLSCMAVEECSMQIDAYNADIANQLNMLQSMLETGAISPADLSVNVTSEQELADINAWLERLAQNMPPQQQDGVMLDQNNGGSSSNNVNIAPQSSTSPSSMYGGMPPVTENPLLSASYPIANNNNAMPMYPSPEQDMYVRSHPMQMYEDSVAAAMYGMTPDVAASIAPHHHQYNPDLLMSTTGYREHYVPISDIAQPNYITPDIRTSVNYTSSNKSSVKTGSTKHRNPEDSKVDKKEVSETFKPGLLEASEQKKNITTMANVFTSADQDKAPSSSNEKKTKEKQPEQEAEETAAAAAAAASKPAPNKDVIDVLSKDFASLAVVETKSATSSSNKPLYPSLDKAAATTTTKSTTTTTKTATTSSTSSVQDHRQLLELIGRQINNAFAQRKANVPSCSNAPARTGSVQVQ